MPTAVVWGVRRALPEYAPASTGSPSPYSTATRFALESEILEAGEQGRARERHRHLRAPRLQPARRAHHDVQAQRIDAAPSGPSRISGSAVSIVGWSTCRASFGPETELSGARPAPSRRPWSRP